MILANETYDMDLVIPEGLWMLAIICLCVWGIVALTLFVARRRP